MRDSGDPSPHRRKAEWAQRARVEIIRQLGATCGLPRLPKMPPEAKRGCGETDTGVLQIDHPFGRAWRPAEKSQWGRVAIYRRELRRGLLRVLCRRCNANSSKRHGRSLRARVERGRFRW